MRVAVVGRWTGRDHALALLSAERYHTGQIFALTTPAEVLVLMDRRLQAGQAISELEQPARSTV